MTDERTDAMTDRLVVASNRGPVSWRRSDAGELQATRGFGGLVTALGGALQTEPGTWVSVAMDDDDRAVAAQHAGAPFEVEVDGSAYRLRLLDVGERFAPYYNEVSNRLLWFTLHGLWAEPHTPTGLGWREPWEGGYLPVNRDIGATVAEAMGDGDPEVHLQDYHLCLTPHAVREHRPEARILHYLHTPWAEPGYLARLPDPVVEATLRGLLAADVIGFSSPRWCSAFRRCARDILGARTSGERVDFDGHRTIVADFVLGVDAAALQEAAGSPEAQRAGADLDDELGDRRLVLRVDRTDLSKNILRGLHAYERLLERYPEHRGRVWHYAHLNPSRQGVPEYRAYLASCEEASARIRERFGDDAVTLFVGDDYPRAVAALQRSDVLVANPVVDGTNLVAKEGPTLNRKNGVLVLSRGAGATEVLAEPALLVNPYDVEQTATALHQALTMGADERHERAQALRKAASQGAPEDWFAAQRETLQAATGPG